MVTRKELESLMSGGRDELDLARLHAGRASKAGTATFRDAQNESTRNERAFSTICSVWGKKLTSLEQGLKRTQSQIRRNSSELHRRTDNKLWHISVATRFHQLRRLIKRSFFVLFLGGAILCLMLWVLQV
jgi:hypothetical protein